MIVSTVGETTLTVYIDRSFINFYISLEIDWTDLLVTVILVYIICLSRLKETFYKSEDIS